MKTTLATTLSALLFTVLLCLSLPLLASGQEPKEWTWKDAKGNVRSRADLDAILAQHNRWLDSDRKSGTQADLRGADLSEADLSEAELSSADLSHADLSGAHLINTHMSEALLVEANVAGAHFEPRNLPFLDIEQAQGLELMTYDGYPSPLTELRKNFQETGYRKAERQITSALNRREAELAFPIERWFKRIAFDVTCQYGLTPGRPLRIVLWLWLFFSGVYALLMHRPSPSGIYFVGSRSWRGRSNTQGIQIRPRTIRATAGWKVPILWLRREWRVLRAAMFFSLMAAFNIGFRDIDFGRWLRMMTKREYDLKAVGWARTVSGFQSLLSVYLIALWVLTYFGRPFE
jgi:hypothetical protein